MWRAAVTTVAMFVMIAGPVSAHDHGGDWSVATSGPRLGLGAGEILRAAPPPGGIPLEFDRQELLRINQYLPAPHGESHGPGEGASGGPAVVHRAGGVPVTAGPELLVTPTAEQFNVGITAAEPTMAITEKGTLFFVAIAGAGSQLMRSRDRGKTWEEAGLALGPSSQEQPVTLDPFIYLDEDTQRLFNVDFLPPCSPVVHTDDEGESYETGSVCNHTDHQNLFTGPPKTSTLSDAYPNMVYYCSIDGGLLFAFGTFTACSKSIDGGMTFTRTGAPPFTDDPTQEGGSQGVKGHCGGAVGHGAVGPDGTVYLPRGWCGQPFIAISDDEGVTWERVQVADNGMPVRQGQEEHEAGVAVDKDGVVYYAWVANDRLPYLAISRDQGRTWSKPMMVAVPGVNESTLPTVTVGDPGRVAIAYLGTKNSPGPPFCARTTGTGSCVNADGSPERPGEEWNHTTWNGYITMTVDALTADPVFYTGSVNHESDPLFRRQCGPNRCGVTHDFFDVQIGPDGTPWASLIDECPEEADSSCASLGIGVVGHLVGGRPLTGPLPPLPMPPPPAIPAPPPCTPPRYVLVKLPSRLGTAKLRRLRVTVNGKRASGARQHRRRWIRIARSRTGGGKLTIRVRAFGKRGKRVTFTRRVAVC